MVNESDIWMRQATPTHRSSGPPPTIPGDRVRIAAGLKRVGELAEPIIRQTCSKFGFTEIRILRDWEWIAGRELASRCYPVRISARPSGERILFVRAHGAQATEVAHQAHLLLERIATACGYKAVDLIRITQIGAPSSFPSDPPAAISVQENRQPGSIEQAVAQVQNPELREALGRLGNAIGSSNMLPNRKSRSRQA